MEINKNEPILLDEVKVSVVNQRTDEIEEVPVLHSSLCQDSSFGLLYQKIDCNSESDVEQSCNLLDELLFCMHWLLSLPYEKFWCQVVNDKSIHACLDSYLRLSPRYRQLDWPQDLNEKHSNLHRATFLIFLRMSTFKETKEHLMSSKLFSKLIYDNYLFDIPRIMDLCTLYNVPENLPLLKKMINSLFHNQPQFFNDLEMAAETVSKIFLQMEEKCFGSSDVDAEPSKLSNGQNKCLLHHVSDPELADLIYYVSDITKTLESFIVDVFPDAAQPFYEHNLIDGLLMLYSDILPEIKAILKERERTLGFAVHFELRCHVRQSRDNLMKIVNGTLQNCVYLPVIESAKQGNDEKTEKLTEKYFEILSSFLSNPKFFNDFCARFSTRKDVQNLSKICPSIAEAHSSFLFLDSNDSLQADSSKDPNDDSRPTDAYGDFPHDQPSTSKAAHGARSHIEEVKMTSSVTSILDVLPDLEVDFVKKCLPYYEMNPEKVIQAIFEDNLPPHLASAKTKDDVETRNQHVGSSSSKSDRPASSKNVDLLKSRRNVFDNDEFDVFARGSKIDMSRVHFGKRDVGEISHWSKGDSDDVAKLRSLYNRYGLDAEDTDNDEFLANVRPTSNYDDEYDDTYDDADIGANDADSVDELGEEKKQEVVEERPRHKFGKPDFVENPEKVRARKAERIQKREEYFASRGGRSSRGSRTRGKNLHERSEESSDKRKNYSARNQYPSKGNKDSIGEKKDRTEQDGSSVGNISSSNNLHSTGRNNNTTHRHKKYSDKNEEPAADNKDHVSAEGASNGKKVDRKKTEYRQTRGGHSRKMLATKKASRGMFMSK